MIFSKTILFIYIILSLSSCSYTHTRTPEGNELTSDFVEGLKITEGWINDLQKEVNCCYDQKYTLMNIANTINSLDDHKVKIQIENKSKLEFYCTYNNEFPIDVIGLEKGIDMTYKVISHE